MYASGSTWAYNIIRGIAGAAYPGVPIRGRFVGTSGNLAGLDTPDTVQTVKSHDLPPEVARALLDHAPRIVATIRDPRDAVTSLMRYQRYPFPMALDTIATSARFVATLVDDPRTLLLRYESGFTDRPETLAEIAAWLGLKLSPADRDTLFTNATRGAIETRIAALDALPDAVRDPRSGDIYDPETQWHRHHAGRTGEVGRWRSMLSFAQVDMVQRAMADWMERFVYPPQVQPVFNFAGFDPFAAARTKTGGA